MTHVMAAAAEGVFGRGVTVSKSVEHANIELAVGHGIKVIPPKDFGNLQIRLPGGDVPLPGSVVRAEASEDGGRLVRALRRALGQPGLGVGGSSGVQEGERLDGLVGIRVACSSDRLAVAEVRDADGVGEAVGYVDGRGERVHGGAAIAGKVPRGAARRQEVGLAAQVGHSAGGGERRVDDRDRLGVATPIDQSPRQAGSRGEYGAMIIEAAESIERIAERGVGLIVETLRGEGGAQDLACTCGERGIVVGVADEHECFAHRLVVPTFLHQMRGSLVEGCSTLCVGKPGIAQRSIQGAEHLGTGTIGACDLIRERVELLAESSTTQALGQGACLVDGDACIGEAAQMGECARATHSRPGLEGVEVAEVLTCGGQGEGADMEEALALVLSVGSQHVDVAQGGVDIDQGLVVPAQRDERLGSPGALKGHRVGAAAGPCLLFARTGIGEEGLRLVAHGRLICHPSTMAHVTGRGCQGLVGRDPQGIPWRMSLIVHTNVAVVSQTWIMV